MTTWAIGDVQGCFEPLRRLLLRVAYRPGEDRLCFVGDLVNRGPDSLETLRFMVEHDVTAVLGNHDIYALARWLGVTERTRDDTLDALLAAPDRDRLFAWLVSRPVLTEVLGHTLVHGGILPGWTLTQAHDEARAIEAHLRGDARALLSHYFQRPRLPFDPSLGGLDRACAALNVFVRLRFVDARGAAVKGATPPERPPRPDARPWFLAGHWEHPIVFGHWAALGLWLDERVAGLDSGCVWGNSLTALDLEARRVFSVCARDPDE